MRFSEFAGRGRWWRSGGVGVGGEYRGRRRGGGASFMVVYAAAPSVLYQKYIFWMRVVVVVVDRFYIALFSALEQTHCVRM